MRKTLLILAFTTTLVQLGYGQSLKQILESAEDSYAKKDFYSALVAYRDAAKLDSTRADIQYRIGESARQFNSYGTAVKAYVKVLGSKDKSQYPDTRFWLGESLHKLADYRNAKSAYLQYMQENPNTEKPNQALLKLAQKKIEDCDFALKSKANEQTAQRNSNYYPRPINMGNSINGPFTDYGASFHGDTLYHTSYEFKEGRNKDARFNKVIRTYPGQPKEPFSLINEVEKHTAYSVFTPNNEGLYYCLCEPLNAYDLRCDIYYRSLLTPGATPIKLGINTKDTDQTKYTSTSPAVGKNSRGEQILYFATDRAGGKGKLDIWAGTILPDGNVTTASPVEELNTPENDLTPFFYENPGKASLLFFATDGRPSFGGIDIYATQLNDQKRWITPYNLGYNINSSYDDFGYVRNPKGDSLVFSSNRKGSTPFFTEKAKKDTLEQEVCCHDLYKAEVYKLVNLEVNTFKQRDSLALTGATVSIIEKNSNGTEKELLKKTDDLGNQFTTLIERYKTYFIKAEKNGFISEDTLVLANLHEDQTTLIVDLYLPNLYLDVFTWIGPESKNNTALKGCTVSLYEKTATGQKNLISTSTKQDISEYSYNVLFEKVYYVTATKAGYSPAEAEISFDRNTIDQFGYELTIDLFLEPQGIELIDGINLFFDNAKPGPGNSVKTSENYKKLYDDYLSKKGEFTGGRYGSLVLESFFTNEVEVGYRKLEDLIPKLKDRLLSGMTVKIYADGFASPLGNIDFNKRLGARRMESVINYLSIYNNGELKEFIDKKQLSFELKPVGESEDGKEVPILLNDYKEVIFSTKASQARRVTIKKISVTNVEQPK